MGYYDKRWVSDRHVLDIVKRQNINAQLLALDAEIKAVCLARGVLPADIPVDAKGHLKSAMLRRYADFWLYFTILHDYWGTSGMDNGTTMDIYKDKLSFYDRAMVAARNDLTADNILEKPLNASSYVRQVVVY